MLAVTDYDTATCTRNRIKRESIRRGKLPGNKSRFSVLQQLRGWARRRKEIRPSHRNRATPPIDASAAEVAICTEIRIYFKLFGS